MLKVTIFWHRRDLRIEDNAGLFAALNENDNVIPIFIFDENILCHLSKDDARVSFIYDKISALKEKYQNNGSDLHVYHGLPIDIFKKITQKFAVQAVYTNHDYEPDAIKRDNEIEHFLRTQKIVFKTYKDQCLFEKKEILNKSNLPYTVFTPYSRQWKEQLKQQGLPKFPAEKKLDKLLQIKKKEELVTLASLGFKLTQIIFPEQKIKLATIKKYHLTRDIPSVEQGTSHLGVHLRFGTLSVRQLIAIALKENETFLNELIWREFFMQILWNFPHVEKQSFRTDYDKIKWRQSEKDFQAWCAGQTGYPLVDAGMRELVATGHMHNRVRMVVASFLTKHLLIHWSKGERFFAKHLLDYDFSANNGNWQWAAGSGCDAAPYFRIFNPQAQAEKFDPENVYIRRWVPEFETDKYVKPIIDHQEARSRALITYGQVLKKDK